MLLTRVTGKSIAQSTGNAFDLLKAVKEIATRSDLYAKTFSKSVSKRLGSFYTTDTKILNGGIPCTIGREAIIHYFGDMIRGGITKLSYVSIGVWGSDNDFVVEEGNLTFALMNRRVAAKGKYLLEWKRAEGRLKIFRDSFFHE